MEKIPAVCAMDWSIELEKGLRSKTKGLPIEAIKRIGPKLQRWSIEPCITREISDMYGSVPGEERTFANTILLRLADAFRSGDNCTRGCILKVFLVEFRHLSKKGRSYNGILSKQRVPNYVEILKRVKAVYDSGNVEAKALSLRLFGCFSDLAKDNPQVRYMILLSLQSSHVSEAKASLFAAGCFCLLSDDFACIILEILVEKISSLQASFGVILAAVRAFSKLRCSSSVANRAYEAGKKLVMGSLKEEHEAEMLSSLSKLALKSSLLLTKQMDFLLSYLSGHHASPLMASTLNCLHFLLCEGAYHFPINKYGIDKLLHVIDDNGLPLNFQCEALRILRKIFFSGCADLQDDIFYLFKVVMIVGKVAQSNIERNRHLALRLLVDILFSLKRERGGLLCLPCDTWQDMCFQFQEAEQVIPLDSTGDGPAFLVSYVTSLIIDHIASLMKQMFVGCVNEPIPMRDSISSDAHSKMEQECKSFLILILNLVELYPLSGCFSLNRVMHLIQTIIPEHEKIDKLTAGICGGIENANCAVRHLDSGKEEQMSIVSCLIQWICRFADACLNILDEAGKIDSEVNHRMELLVQCLQQSRFCDFDTYGMFRICMRSCIGCHTSGTSSTQNQDQSKDDEILGFFNNVCWSAQEWRILEFTKKMLGRANYWVAYKVGKYSCRKGLWFAATFTFRKLIGCVQSDSCCRWLRSLMLLSGGESEMKLLLFPEVGIEFINVLQRESNFGESLSSNGGCSNHCADIDSSLHDLYGRLARVYSRICSSEEILAASGSSDGVYHFQRWFLSLRAKVLEVLMKLLGLLSSHELTKDNLNKGYGVDATDWKLNFPCSIATFASISIKLNKLAKDYDLLATSFLDIDCRSFRCISTLALNCSLLSFCTTFTFFFSNQCSYESGESCSLSNSEKYSHAVILRDLVERLHVVDDNITMLLQQFMTFFVEVTDNFQSRTQLNSNGCIEKASLLVCKFAIPGVLHMQEEAKKNKHEDQCLLFMRGLQLLSKIIRKWMIIPFQIPKYFFQVRPCVGAELFIFSSDSRNSQDIFLPLGFQLSLNLCIRLKNAPTNPSARLSKVYCIIASKSSDSLSCGKGSKGRQMQPGFQARNTNEMVLLAEMLLTHLTDDTKKASKISAKASDGSSEDLVTAFVCFELNHGGQGFSSCLLDVSRFCEGLYPFRWHCCCIDTNGSLWSLLPLNAGASAFTIKAS